MIETDVLVVGAGPVGSTAAKHAAKGGAKVILVDRKSEIGSPKRCAEGIYDRGLQWLGIEPDERWIAQTIYGGVIYAPNGDSLTVDETALPEHGYVLERKVFDKHMAMDAARAGAEIKIKTLISNIRRSDNGFIATCESMGETYEISTKILIGADGPESIIGKMAGLDTTTSPKYMMSCVQYEMCNVDCVRDELIEFYLGEEYASGGYAWIFPKGNGVANVGLGIAGDFSEKTAKECLDKFVKTCPHTQNAQAVEFNVGGDPISGLLDKIYDDNIMLCGDAAGQVDPIEGGGIILGMMGGMAAGQVAASAIKEGNYSANKLKEYPEKFNESTFNVVPKLPVARDLVLELEDKDYNKLVEAANKLDLTNVGTKDVIKVFLKLPPRLSLKFTKLFKMFL
ncbi:MAG: geranylgeranyl reductase family protein [Methanosphaera sp.]